MDIKLYENRMLIRLDEGDELLACLKKACLGQGVKRGVFSGFGQLSSLVMGRPQPGKELHGEMQLLSLAGNVAEGKGGMAVECCFSAAAEDGSVVGGRLQKGVAGTSIELVVEVLVGQAYRNYGGEHSPLDPGRLWANEG